MKDQQRFRMRLATSSNFAKKFANLLAMAGRVKAVLSEILLKGASGHASEAPILYNMKIGGKCSCTFCDVSSEIVLGEKCKS